MSKTKKPLRDLTMMDRFLFDTVMSDKEQAYNIIDVDGIVPEETLRALATIENVTKVRPIFSKEKYDCVAQKDGKRF